MESIIQSFPLLLKVIVMQIEFLILMTKLTIGYVFILGGYHENQINNIS